MRELCYKVVIVGKVGYCSSVISAHVVALAIFASVVSWTNSSQKYSNL